MSGGKKFFLNVAVLSAGNVALLILLGGAAYMIGPQSYPGCAFAEGAAVAVSTGIMFGLIADL